MSHHFRFLAILALTLSCSLAIPGPARADEILVSAAASLREAFIDIGRSFQQKHPTDTVVFNFGASGALAAQIEQGAPVDVFAAANQAHMDRLQRQALIVAATRRDFTSNALVMIRPAGGKIEITAPADTLRPEVKHVAMGNPATVPAGQYAKQALVSLGLWDQLQPKLVLGADVRQVREYVARGEVEAGLVFASDAVVPQVRVAIKLGQGLHEPILYPVAMLKGARHQAQAEAFVNFLLSAPAQRILADKGFQPVIGTAN